MVEEAVVEETVGVEAGVEGVVVGGGADDNAGEVGVGELEGVVVEGVGVGVVVVVVGVAAVGCDGDDSGVVGGAQPIDRNSIASSSHCSCSLGEGGERTTTSYTPAGIASSMGMS